MKSKEYFTNQKDQLIDEPFIWLIILAVSNIYLHKVNKSRNENIGI